MSCERFSFHPPPFFFFGGRGIVCRWLRLVGVGDYGLDTGDKGGEGKGGKVVGDGRETRKKKRKKKTSGRRAFPFSPS